MPQPTPGETRPFSPVWWDAAAVVVSVITLGLVALSGFGRQPAVFATVAGVLIAFLVTYALFGRRTLDGYPGWPIFTGLLAVFALIGAGADPAFATFQTIAFPLVWLCAPNVRLAIPGNVAVALAVVIGYAFSSGSVIESVIVEALSLGFSLAMGIWISGIADLSKQRRDLLDQLTAAQGQVAALHHEQGVVSERVRLARELHDTIAQSLTGIVMLAERARAQHPDDVTLGVLEDSARQALTETRGLVAATASVPLDGGLRGAIGMLGERFSRETGVTVTTTVTVDVPRGLEVVLLRCAQEGLANVRKHAHASAATVDVRAEGDRVRLTVSDDGAGFDGARFDRAGPDSAGLDSAGLDSAGLSSPGLDNADLSSGFGLSGMRDRLALVGGEVRLAHGEPRGTVLDVRVPVESSTAFPLTRS